MKKKSKRSILIMMILIFIAIIAIVIGGIALRLVYLSSSTKGDNIGKYNNPRSALIVIDIQNDTLSIPEYGDTSLIMERINSTIEYASKSDMEIIYVRQVYTAFPDTLLTGGMYKAGSTGTELSSQLSIQSNNVFNKLRADAFSITDFEQYLIEKEIDTLYIVGADASACVYKTALGGIDRGYQVVIINDCLFSLNEKVLNTMLDKYQKAGIKTIESNIFTAQ